MEQEWTLVTRNDKRCHVRAAGRRRKGEKVHNKHSSTKTSVAGVPGSGGCCLADVGDTSSADQDETSSSSSSDVMMIQQVVLRKLEELMPLLRCSDFYQNLKNRFSLLLQQHTPSNLDLVEQQEARPEPSLFCRVICYGLGNFTPKVSSTTTTTTNKNNNNTSATITSSYLPSIWQLALLSCIVNDFFIPSSSATPRKLQRNRRQRRQQRAKLFYYDPCTLPVEKELLNQIFPQEKLLHILTANDRGKICLINNNNDRCGNDSGECVEDDHVDDNDDVVDDDESDDGLVLFFMPHCPMLLYENVLWAHWEHFMRGKAIILGNSLRAYADQHRHHSCHHSCQRSCCRKQKPKSKHYTTSSSTTEQSLLPPCLATIADMTSASASTNHQQHPSQARLPLVQEHGMEWSRHDVAKMPANFERAFNDFYVTTCENECSQPGIVHRPCEYTVGNDDDHDSGEVLM